MIFLILSAILLSISTPISLALDNIAIGLGLIGLLIIYKNIKFKDIDYGILGIQFIGLISALFSIDFIYSLKKSRFLWHFLPYFILSRVKRDKISVFINILGFFGILSSLGVVFQAFTGVRPTNITSHIHLLSHPIRADGFFHHPFTIVGILSIIFLTFLGLFLFSKEKKNRIYYFVVSVIVFPSIIFTMCRSYWIGVSLAIFMLPFLYRKAIVSKVASIFLMILFIFMYEFVPIIHKRVQTIIHYNHNYSAEVRLVLWKSGIELYKNYNLKNKLIGCGNNHLAHFTKPYILKNAKQKFGSNINGCFHKSVHNLYLQLLLQWGILGLLFWIFFWVYVFYRNLIFIAQTDNDFYRAFILGVTMGFIAFLAGGFFEYNMGDSEIAIFITYILGINKNILDSLKEGDV